MGKKNIVTKEYMSFPEYFADAFNYYVFQGKQVIKNENLIERDTSEFTKTLGTEVSDIIQKDRDVLKQCVLMEDAKYTYLLLGIENQSHIHYAMPVRNMIYDALNYGKQLAEKEKYHRKAKDLRGDEFLSGLSKTDKIKPVITLVVYFGTANWDAPRKLKDMFEEMDEEVFQYVSDYQVNLLLPKEIKDFSKFRTDFGKAMRYISVSDKKEECEQLTKEEDYKMIHVETARLLNECIGMEIPIKEGEVQVDMCEAVRGIKEEGRMVGHLEGRNEGIVALVVTLRELGQTDEFILKTIIEKFKLSEKDANKYV